MWVWKQEKKKKVNLIKSVKINTRQLMEVKTNFVGLSHGVVFGKTENRTWWVTKEHERN